MQASEERYYLIDGIRGYTVISMVVYHFLYDIFIVYGVYPPWYNIPPVYAWQQSICWAFIFISGFVWIWGGKDNLKRGLLLNALGFIITAATCAAIPAEAIWFGILNFIGCAVLIMIPLSRVLRGIDPIMGLAVSFALFMLFKRVQYGYIGFGDLDIIRVQMPQALYTSYVLTPLGFPFPGFGSSDYFPVLPWFFLYLCGFFFNGVFMRHESWKEKAKYRVPVLSFIGSRSLWVYMLHQPVIMLICIIISGF